MKNFWKKACLCALLLSTVLLAAGCKKSEPEGKLRDLEFTVIDEDAIPRPLADVIAENKQEEMKLSYQNDGYLYISRGFGQQKTGGYSITVQYCYLGEDGIHVKFELLGPASEKEIPEEPSSPYIVIRTEAMEEPILFD